MLEEKAFAVLGKNLMVSVTGRWPGECLWTSRSFDRVKEGSWSPALFANNALKPEY